MFWDDIQLVTEQIQKYGLRKPFVDLGGLEKPAISDYDLTIKTGNQTSRYVVLKQRPFDHIDPSYSILNPRYGDPPIEDLPFQHTNTFGTAVCLNVIEHVENPIEIFQAFYEIMKPNSLLIISTVFLFPYHPSPRDYWRYSPDCLSYLSKNIGFTILECNWRLSIPASAGILNLKTNKPQEIISVFATLTKGEFTASPGPIYSLPKRISQNETANKLIELEETAPQIDNSLEEAQKYPNSQPALTDLHEARKQVADRFLNLPADELEIFYSADLGQMYQKLLDSGIREQPLTETEKDFVKELLDRQREFSPIPGWEYIPEGWSRQDFQIKGWNVQSILDIRKAQWPHVLESVQGTKPLGNDYGQHNTYMAYAYVLALAARNKDRISLLDWGGGIGDYYLISKALLPEVEIDYHCKDLPLLCQGGRELLPEASFHEDDEDCFKQSYDLVLASSSLQYSQDWQQVLQKLASVTCSYLYITRLPIVHQADSFVVVQRPYQYGYGTEYMGWFLNRKEFLNYVNSLKMELVREFLIQERPFVYGAPEQGESRGFLFRSQTDKQ